MVSNRKIWSYLAGAVSAVLSFFIFGGSLSAHAQTLTHSDVDIGGDSSGVEWKIGTEAGGSVIDGVMDFDVTGLSQSNTGKRQIFSMYDAAQPTPYGNYGYFFHFRKREALPHNLGPGFQIKAQIDCEWPEKWVQMNEEWQTGHTYHFKVEWYQDDDTTNKPLIRVTVTDTSVNPTQAWSGQIDSPWPFFAADHTFVFGAGPASSAAFPAEPGAKYTNITLDVKATDGSDDFGGYPPCDEQFETEPGTREDAPGTDLGDPDDDPNNPYDKCACTSLDATVEPPCEDPKPSDEDTDLKPTPFSLRINWTKMKIELRKNWTLDKVLLAIFGKQKESQPSPAIDLTVAPESVPKGQEATITMTAQHFKTIGRNLLVNWCLTPGDTGVAKSYNEVIAGGKPAQAATPTSWTGGGCCAALTRGVTTDADNDGMDDDWERRYFLGQQVNGVVATSDNVLSLVRPDDDLDGDGYLAIKFMNLEGRLLTVTPALVDHLGRIYRPGEDGKLTNVEEFLLGTNPRDGDTDNDGLGDEMDYLGVGATSFTFTVDLDPGPQGLYHVSASAVGLNNNGLVSIAGRNTKFSVSAGEQLQMALQGNPSMLAISQNGADRPLTLHAEISGGDVKAEDLLFTWSFNGQSVCELDKFKEFCEVGRDTLTLGGSGATVKLVDLPGFDGDVDKISPGTPYSFSVTALDPVSRRSATASLVVPISREVNLTTACTEGAEDQDSLPAEGNGALTICVRELRELGTINLESTNWQWYVDGQSVPAQSGLGKSTFNFEVPKAAGSTARVSLEIMDALSGSLLATAQRTYNVSGPTLRIVEPLSDSYGGGRGTDARRVYGRPGETINFTARASSFPDDMELVYTWSAGAATSSATGLTQFTYVIPDDAEPEAAITVSVAARGISSDGQVLSAADQLVILVGERAAVLGPAGQLKAGLAKVGALIPENLRLALKVVLSIIGMGIIALVVLKFSQKATL